MKKLKEYHICDRCGKEILGDPFMAPDNFYIYELCYECNEIFKKYNEENKKIETKWDIIAKKYKFGKYLPDYYKEELPKQGGEK